MSRISAKINSFSWGPFILKMVRVLIRIVILGMCVSVLGDEVPQGSIQKMLLEVDTSLDHHLPEDRVPSFMRDVYSLMNEDTDNILSGYSHDDLYKYSPVIKSFRARAVIRTKFKFKIPNSSNVSEISSAQLMVKTNNSEVTARYKHTPLSRCEATLSDDYYVFNVTDAVMSHGDDREGHISFHVRHAGGVSKDDVYLILFENISAERLHHSRRRRNAVFQEVHTHFFQRNVANDTSDGDMDECKKREWTLNFEDLGWFWIMHPLTVQVGLCSGRCNLFSSRVNMTNHAFLRTMYHVQNRHLDGSVHPASCMPTEVQPVQLLYFDTNYDISVRLLPEFKVISCGCR